MDTLDSIFKDEVQDTQISGQWSVAQWIPDIATGEVLNIGVSVLTSNGQHEIKMLDNFERLECLFNSKHAAFHAELACQVAREYLSSAPNHTGVISPNLKIENRGFAQGNDIEEIISRLYTSVITLGIPRPKKSRKEPFQHVSRDTAYNGIRSQLKKSLNIEFEHHVPNNPYHKIEDEYGTETIYLPFTKKDPKQAASLATAAYSDSFRVKSYLYDAFRSVETALNQNIINEGALFIVLPGNGLDKSIDEQINDEISTFYSFTKRHGIFIESNDSVAMLTESISNWCVGNSLVH